MPPGLRHSLLRTARAFCALGIFCLYAPALHAQAQELFWHQNYQDALEEARRTGKPIFLEYRCSP